MIRKEGKARWVYTCQPCNERIEAVDQFRAIEGMHRHQRGNITHLQNALAEAMKPVVDFFNRVAAQAEDFNKFLSQPAKNLPHDPSLLRDRRKWGGR